MPNVSVTVRNASGLSATVDTPIMVQPPVAASLSLRLDFLDGKSLSFAQSAAQDVGGYVGPYVQQQCFRQRASRNGDYRDGFTVFFRPDADGTRSEVVIEYGTEIDFSSKPPKPGRGAAVFHLFVPPPPKLTKTTGGSATVARAPGICLSYVTPGGETPACANLQIGVAAGERVVVASPAAAGGATGYNVYAFTGTNLSTLQNASPIPIGQDWTEPTTGLIVGRRPLPIPTAHAYTATVSGGALAVPVTIEVPAHWWGARWRWQSAPRPIVRKLADLVAMKAVLPLDPAMRLGTPNIGTARPWRGPMDTGGLEIGMPTTGDRNDIGLTTEWQAQALLGNAATAVTMLAGAEATGTMTFWVRDAATGNFVDATTHPYVAFTDTIGGYGIPSGAVPPGSAIYFLLDQSHMPSAAFVPWLLTDDPYFLEGAQAQAQYAFMCENYGRNNRKLPCMATTAQPRAWGWALRELFRMAAFAPANPPSWLQPRTYWQKVLQDSLTYAQRFLAANVSPCTTVFKLIPMTSSFQPFMLGYVAITLAWARWSGKFPEWDQVVEYATAPHLAMTSPDSGWDRRFLPYNVPVVDARLGAAANGSPQSFYDVALSPNTPASWKELWDVTQPWFQRNQGNWTDPATWTPGKLHKLQYGYFPEHRAVLAAAALAGIPKAREQHDWLIAEINEMFPGGAPGAACKWAVPAA